jgi:hypothetical protein
MEAEAAIPLPGREEKDMSADSVDTTMGSYLLFENASSEAEHEGKFLCSIEPGGNFLPLENAMATIANNEGVVGVWVEFHGREWYVKANTIEAAA